MNREIELQIENEIRNMGLEQIKQEKALLASELKAIDAQISDMAFNNYGTYADAGRATHHCSKVFGELKNSTLDLTKDVGNLTAAFQAFRAEAKTCSQEMTLTNKALDKTNPLWELLSLPSRMDVCIRAGYYDLAYSLTNYGVQLQQQPQLIKYASIKRVADKLVEARLYLLEELFNKFAWPLDLAEAIKVVNNVRKMPHLSANQLRISVLQHRSQYLDKLIIEISGAEDYALRAIDIYKNVMYETLVLYQAVFQENEYVRKDTDNRTGWKSWPIMPPSAVLSQWAVLNVKTLLELIQTADVKNTVDMSQVWSKLMAMSSSISRMGVDFRPLIVARLNRMVSDRFRDSVKRATIKLTANVRSIALLGVDPATLAKMEAAATVPPAALALSVWDDLAEFTNSVVDALNMIRFTLTPASISTTVTHLRDAIRAILGWLATSHASSPNLSRCFEIIATALVPFLNQCLRGLFPFSTISKLFGSSVTSQQFEQFIEIDIGQLSASCDNSEKIEELLAPHQQKRTVESLDIDKILMTEDAVKKNETEKDNLPVTVTAESKPMMPDPDFVEPITSEPDIPLKKVTTEQEALPEPQPPSVEFHLEPMTSEDPLPSIESMEPTSSTEFTEVVAENMHSVADVDTQPLVSGEKIIVPEEQNKIIFSVRDDDEQPTQEETEEWGWREEEEVQVEETPKKAGKDD